jgi:hypothetical protein
MNSRGMAIKGDKCRWMIGSNRYFIEDLDFFFGMRRTGEIWQLLFGDFIVFMYWRLWRYGGGARPGVVENRKECLESVRF